MDYLKNQMGSIQHEGKTLTCSMGLKWPPIEIVAYGSLEEAKGYVSLDDVQRLQVWEKVCNLRRVQMEKCLSCKFVCLDGVLVNQSDKGRRGVTIRSRSPQFSAGNPKTDKKR